MSYSRASSAEVHSPDGCTPTVQSPMAALSALISATNPATFLGSLSYRGWLGLGVCALLSYCNWISTLARRPKDAPCPEFGRVLRVLYGLFGTRLAEIVLGYFLFSLQPHRHSVERACAIDLRGGG